MICNRIWLVGGAWGFEVVGSDDLQAGCRDDLLVDEDDGVSRTGAVGDLWGRIGGDGRAGGNGSRWDHHDAVGAGWDVEVAGVDAEADAGNERSD